MRTSIASTLACLFLAACASTPQPQPSEVAMTCIAKDPQTGSNIARRDVCTPAVQSEEETRRRVEELKRDQQMMEAARPAMGAQGR
jgi:hypothetical protein